MRTIGCCRLRTPFTGTMKFRAGWRATSAANPWRSRSSSQLKSLNEGALRLPRSASASSLHCLFDLLRIRPDLLQIFSAQPAIRGQVVVIFHDVFVKGNDGSIETRIVDGNVAPFPSLPDAVLHLSLLEFDSQQLGLQQVELRIQSNRTVSAALPARARATTGERAVDMAFCFLIETISTSFLWLACMNRSSCGRGNGEDPG